MKKILTWIAIAGFLLTFGGVVWGIARAYTKWEGRMAAVTASSSVRGEDVDRTLPPPSQNLPTAEPAATDSTESEDRWMWPFITLMALALLGLPTLSVLSRLVDALETKWSQRPA